MASAIGMYSALNTYEKASPMVATASRTALLAPRVNGAIHRIVVPVDGSRVAEHALPHAIALARRLGTAIRLVHVMSLFDPVDPWRRSHGPSSTDNYKREMHRYLISLANRVRAAIEGDIEEIMIEDPDIAGSLSMMTNASTLVVMATRSKGLLKGLLSGNVAEELIDKTHGPLLLVRGSSAPVELSSDPIPRHIVVPLDGSECSEKVLPAATLLGSLGGARFSLVHMGHSWSHRREMNTAHAYLKGVAMKSMKHAPALDVEVMISEHTTATDIVKYADVERADWLTLTTHTRSMWARLFGTGVANAVIRHANIPLLIVRHAEKKDEECGDLLTTPHRTELIGYS